MASLAGSLWDGVRLRRVRAAPDPDAAPRAVAIPLAWDEEQAAALAALAPGGAPVALPRLAEAWIATLAERARRCRVAGDAAEAAALAEALRALLLTGRGAPGAGIWRAEAKAPPRFVLNLPAFLDAEGGFDPAAYAAAVALAVRALDGWTGAKATRLSVGFADLAGLLAALGLAYESPEARAVAAAIAALTRGAAEAESGRLAERLGAREPVALLAPAPPGETPVPGLAAAARAALDAAAGCAGLRHQALVALSSPDAAEALLGAESGGVAPAPGPSRLALDGDGWVAEVPTRAARRIGRAAAERLLAPVPQGAWVAMAGAVAPFLHAAPPLPAAEAAPARAPAPPPRPAPARATAGLWRATVAGHRVVLRAVEDAAGRPVELSLALPPRETAATRALTEALLASVSLGLAAGVPLAAFVEAHLHARIGVPGAVEGDPAIRRATGVLDWAFRVLAREYLGQHLPDPEDAETLAGTAANAPGSGPLLPLDLPEAPSPRARRRQLKLVG